MLCIAPISMFLQYISQYLLPHSMDPSNCFVLSSYYSIHLFFPSRYFLPCSGMSQEVNFAFSDIFTLFLCITSNFYCKNLLFCSSLVGITIHMRSKIWTD